MKLYISLLIVLLIHPILFGQIQNNKTYEALMSTGCTAMTTGPITNYTIHEILFNGNFAYVKVIRINSYATKKQGEGKAKKKEDQPEKHLYKVVGKKILIDGYEYSPLTVNKATLKTAGGIIFRLKTKTSNPLNRENFTR
ncbi:hypothetical protein [Chryseobacterium vrystaatense]|uniref:Uncharacterized protein n=1 Tax=Chryseobacterium vrystaatense TaxID=307480 RepID=A0A1M5G7D3_9FLAO|nr:hypothetical protein [Chryseobacterium vrystaatense]SHF99371.1 hypothetical protein SAMN02787073_3251 [Chryseobacterium vrystaatense]